MELGDGKGGYRLKWGAQGCGSLCFASQMLALTHVPAVCGNQHTVSDSRAFSCLHSHEEMSLAHEVPPRQSATSHCRENSFRSTQSLLRKVMGKRQFHLSRQRDSSTGIRSRGLVGRGRVKMLRVLLHSEFIPGRVCVGLDPKLATHCWMMYTN